MIGTLYIVSAPSGAGKTSLVNALVESVPGMVVSVSHTTRPRRERESEGVHYHFIDDAHFQEMVAAGEFLEHACVFGNRYGTCREQVLRQLARGTDVILEIDWQGAAQVRTAMPGCVSVFILPPSRAELEHRLRGRGEDSDDVIAARMREAVNEMSHYQAYDYLLVNDDFDAALADLSRVVRVRRLRREAQEEHLAPVLRELLG